MSDAKKKIIKRVTILMICLLFLVFLFVLFVAKIEEISSWIIAKKQAYAMRSHTVTKVDFDSYPALEDKPDAWYLGDGRMISHACGGIDGLTYTNSREALELAIRKGFRVIEVDFSLTKDGHVVCWHDWQNNMDQNPDWSDDNPPTLDAFLSTPVYHKYTALSFRELLDYMEEHPEIFIVTDIKSENETYRSIVQGIVADAKDTSREAILDRLVIQIYKEEEYDLLLEYYPFKNFLFTTYKYADYDLNNTARICLDKGIHVVTLPTGWIDSEEKIKVFTDKNIKVFTNTLNTVGGLRMFAEHGVSGFYTDFLDPTDLTYIDN